jgi:hypothetical protein
MSSTTTGFDRAALHAWVDARLDHVEATPIPTEMQTLADGERFTADETLALWQAAGLASRIGMVLAMEPGQFVIGFPADLETSDGGDTPEAAAAPDA